MIPQSKTIYLTSLIPEFPQTRFLSNVHLHLNLTLFNRISENVIGNAEKITGRSQFRITRSFRCF